jgi:hypothetical protein
MAADFDVAALVRQAAPVPPLPAPEGTVVRVKDAAGFIAAVKQAKPDSTILLEDGHYRMPHDVTLRASGVTIRSASGQRDKVVIDGEGADLTSHANPLPGAPAILRITHAQRVTVADVTFRNSPKYAVVFYGDGEVHNLTVHNVVFHNIWVRGLKGTHPARPDDRDLGERNFPPEKVELVRPRDGRVRHCLFYCDHIKTDRTDGFDGDYISGIDCMGLKDWVFSDNIFANIRGANGGGRAGIFIWQGATNVVCERNLFIACDRGISFGNYSQKTVSVTGGAIRDNRFVAGVNMAIECCTTRNIDVSGNRIVDPGVNTHHVVRFLEGNNGGHFHDNVLCGTLATDATVLFARNIIGLHFRDAFVDPANGNLEFNEKGKAL